MIEMIAAVIASAIMIAIISDFRLLLFDYGTKLMGGLGKNCGIGMFKYVKHDCFPKKTAPKNIV